ncbi:MAG: PEP-CTERM sorting domain-containing protein [Phycisphaeraceae bacterium]
MRTRHKHLAILSAFTAMSAMSTLAGHAHAVLVNSTWNGGSGSWQNAANWTPNTQFPNNGNGGDTYNATVSAGQATLNAGVTIEQLSLTGGAIALNGNDLFADQPFTWTGGIVFGPGSLITNIIEISGGTNKLLSNSFLVNNNSTTMTGTGSLIGLDGAQIQNETTGIFDLLTDTSILNGGGTFTYINKGKFRKVGGAGNSNAQAIVDNTGSVEARSGTLTLTNAPTQLAASVLNGGAWIAANGGHLLINAIINALGPDTTVTLDGAGSSFNTINGITSNQGKINVQNGATFNPTAATLTNTGEVNVTGGSNLTTANHIINDTPGKIQITNSTVHSNTLDNDGEIHVNQPGGILIVDGKLLNNGLLVVNGMVQSGDVLDNSGQLRGKGTIQADVLNSGLIAPGLGDGTDILTIMGNLELAPSGELEIGLKGTTPGSEHDQLIVDGTAILGGTLRIVGLAGLSFLPGDVFNILLAGAIQGSFSDVILPLNGNNEPLFEVLINSTSVQLRALRIDQPPVDGTIPEPATFATLLLGGACLTRSRRRRA